MICFQEPLPLQSRELTTFAAREAAQPGMDRFEGGHGGEILLLPLLLIALVAESVLGWLRWFF